MIRADTGKRIAQLEIDATALAARAVWRDELPEAYRAAALRAWDEHRAKHPGKEGLSGAALGQCPRAFQEAFGQWFKARHAQVMAAPDLSVKTALALFAESLRHARETTECA